MHHPEPTSNVPVIDVSTLGKGDTAQDRSVARQLYEAARHIGFFYICGHAIAPSLFTNLCTASQQFFALPLEEKMKTYIGRSDNHRGYVPEGEEVFENAGIDKKEAFDLSLELPSDDPDYKAGTPFIGPNQWPTLPGFSSAARAYYSAVFDLGLKLMRGFAIALGEAPDYFDSSISKPPAQLRLIHYPANPAAADSIGIGAHSDYECFTLLYVTAPGLEVLNQHGDWIDVPPLPGTFIVNIGDMMEIMSNGLFRAATHRVRKMSEERYSFPLFFTLDYYTKVSPLPRFVRPGMPQKDALIAGDHLFERTAQSFRYLKERLERQPEIRSPTFLRLARPSS